MNEQAGFHLVVAGVHHARGVLTGQTEQPAGQPQGHRPVDVIRQRRLDQRGTHALEQPQPNPRIPKHQALDVGPKHETHRNLVQGFGRGVHGEAAGPRRASGTS